jgi:hypothetical protein
VGEGRETRRRTIGDALGLHAEDGWFLALRDVRSGTEWLHGSRDVHEQGLNLSLDAYTTRVFLGVREVQDVVGRPWGRLAQDLDGGGVASLDDALRDLLLRPVQEPLRRLLEPARLHSVATTTDGEGTDLLADVRELVAAARGLMEPPTPGDPTSAAERVATGIIEGLRSLAALPTTASAPATTRPTEQPPAAPVEPFTAAWVVLHGLPDAVRGEGRPADARAWIDEWRLAPAIADAFRDAGVPEADAWRSVEAVKALLTLPSWDLRLPPADRVTAILEAWLADASAIRYLQVNVHRDVRWFNREALEALAQWAALVERLRAGAARPSVAALNETVDALVAQGSRSGYRLDDLVPSKPVVMPRSG